MKSPEEFYVRNNITHQWIMKSGGILNPFVSQRAAKRYADKHLNKFTIVSMDTKTRKLKWRGGDRLCHIKYAIPVMSR